MTCIVGLISDGRVFLGADSGATGSSFNKVVRKDPKIYRIGEFLIGFTSSYRMGQILGYSLAPPIHSEGMTIEEYLCTLFVDHVRDLLKTKGFASINSNVETGGLFLLAYQGRLFHFESDFQVGESIHCFDSVGSASDVALGSMYAT